MKLLRILSLLLIGYGFDANAAAGAVAAGGTADEETVAAGAKPVSVLQDVTITDKGFSGRFDHGGKQYILRTANRGDWDDIPAFRETVTHKYVTSKSRLESRQAAMAERIAEGNFHAWMVVRRLNGDGEEGDIETVLMGGTLPSAVLKKTEDASGDGEATAAAETYVLKTPYNIEDPDHVKLMQLFGKEIGIRYKGLGKDEDMGDAEVGTAVRESNKGVATLMPAFPESLDDATAIVFAQAGWNAFAELRTVGQLLPEDTTDAHGEKIRGTKPGVIITPIDLSLANVYAKSGAEVITEPWTNTLYGDNAIAVYRYR